MVRGGGCGRYRGTGEEGVQGCAWCTMVYKGYSSGGQGGHLMENMIKILNNDYYSCGFLADHPNNPLYSVNSCGKGDPH